jgi:hypothetical protein
MAAPFAAVMLLAFASEATAEDHGKGSLDVPTALLQTFSSLKQVTSYSAKGTINVQYAKELWDGTSKTVDFEVVSQNSSTKLSLNETSPPSVSTVPPQIQYQTPGSYIRYSPLARSAVSSTNPYIFGSHMLDDLSMPFLNFSFLTNHSDFYGISPVTPSLFKDGEAWCKSLLRSDACITSKNGKVTLSYKQGVNIWDVDFSTPATSSTALVPTEIRFYIGTNDPQHLIRRLRVDAFSQDPLIGFVPAKLVIELYRGPYNVPDHTPTRLIATYTISITDTKLNPSVNENEFDFDLSTADTIFDSDNNKRIKVPR